MSEEVKKLAQLYYQVLDLSQSEFEHFEKYILKAYNTDLVKTFVAQVKRMRGK